MDEVYIVYMIFADGSIDLKHVCLTEERAKELAEEGGKNYEYESMKVTK